MDIVWLEPKDFNLNEIKEGVILIKFGSDILKLGITY